MKIIEVLQRLVRAHGVSGNENRIREMILEIVSPYADQCETDPMGNLIVRKKGPGAKVMIAAHMDSVGMVATHIEEAGFIRFGGVGGLEPAQLLQTPVRFSGGVMGLIAANEDAEMDKLSINDLYIDIGAASREEAARQVRLGDTASYYTSTFRTGSRIISPYLDNRIGCFVLLETLTHLRHPVNDLYFVFTVQEEVGCRGVKPIAYGLDPDYGIVVDVTDACDTPEAKHTATAKLGGGAAVKVMDRSVICHPRMIELLNRLAKEEQIPVQQDIMQLGGTDAGAMQSTRLGVVAGGISVPCRYAHAPTEMVSIDDVESCVQLLTAFCSTKLERYESFQLK